MFTPACFAALLWLHWLIEIVSGHAKLLEYGKQTRRVHLKQLTAALGTLPHQAPERTIHTGKLSRATCVKDGGMVEV